MESGGSCCQYRKYFPFHRTSTVELVKMSMWQVLVFQCGSSKSNVITRSTSQGFNYWWKYVGSWFSRTFFPFFFSHFSLNRLIFQNIQRSFFRIQFEKGQCYWPFHSPLGGSFINNLLPCSTWVSKTNLLSLIWKLYFVMQGGSHGTWLVRNCG